MRSLGCALGWAKRVPLNTNHGGQHSAAMVVVLSCWRVAQHHHNKHNNIIIIITTTISAVSSSSYVLSSSSLAMPSWIGFRWLIWRVADVFGSLFLLAHMVL